MLIPLKDLIEKYRLSPLKSVLHVGAHRCEESAAYEAAKAKSVVWIEAIPELAAEMRRAGHNVHQAVASDVDGEDVSFKIMNNTQSSSMLDLGTHSTLYPDIRVVRTIQQKTTRLDTLGQKLGWNWPDFGFLNIDVQGSELKVLKGIGKNLTNFKAIYTEINMEYVYKNCALVGELDAYLSTFGFKRVETATDIGQKSWSDALYLKTTETDTKPTETGLLIRHVGRRNRLGAQMIQIASAVCLSSTIPKSVVLLSPTWPQSTQFAGLTTKSVRTYQPTREPAPSMAVDCSTVWPTIDRFAAASGKIVELTGSLQFIQQIVANRQTVLPLFEPSKSLLDRAINRLAAAGVGPLTACVIHRRSGSTVYYPSSVPSNLKPVLFNYGKPDDGLPTNVTVMPSVPDAAIVDLIAISLCAAIVPGDSTFAWMAAYLSNGAAQMARRYNKPALVIRTASARYVGLPDWTTIDAKTVDNKKPSTDAAEIGRPMANNNNNGQNGVVYVETVGGLGNQLFQIAAALQYARWTNRLPVFRRAPDSYSVLGPRKSYWSTLFTDLKQVDTYPDEKTVKVHDDQQSIGKSIPDYAGSNAVLLKGYYQSLVHTAGSPIRYWPLLFPTSAIDESKRLLSTVAGNDLTRTAFIHIRRGDYKSLSYFHPVLPLAYYERSAQEFQPTTRYIIFCEQEDIDAVRTDFASSTVFQAETYSFVDCRIDDYLQMLMMALCPRGGIIANSTFSCWSAHLRPVLLPSDKSFIIVAPLLWFVGTATPAIFGDDWRRIGPPFVRLAEPSSSSSSSSVSKPINRKSVIRGILQYGHMHHRNQHALDISCAAWKIPYKRIDNLDDAKKPEFADYNVLWLPSSAADPDQLAAGKIILFGPHLFVFPEGQLAGPESADPKWKRTRYAQPGLWTLPVCNEFGGVLPKLVVLPFAVDTDSFRPSDEKIERSNILVYHKHRPAADLAVGMSILSAEQKAKTRVFSYGSYSADDYRSYLKTCRFGIWIGSTESQGFGLQEALSSGIPLLVWNVRSMFAEYCNGRYTYEHLKGRYALKGTTVPYWSDECGEIVYEAAELADGLKRLLQRTDLDPRSFVLRELSIDACMNRLADVVADASSS